MHDQQKLVKSNNIQHRIYIIEAPQHNHFLKNRIPRTCLLCRRF